MKQIVKNFYIKALSFTSPEEASFFVSNQRGNKYLSIDDTFGNNYYCYIGYHSLTKEKQFLLSFSSDQSEDDLNFLVWDRLIVLDTGKTIYLIDEILNIIKSFEITTPLVGLYLTNAENLLVLEEAYMRVINCKGDVLKAELFDLMEDFSIKDDLLLIQTNVGSKAIKLI
jgi:hypothetical protein